MAVTIGCSIPTRSQETKTAFRSSCSKYTALTVRGSCWNFDIRTWVWPQSGIDPSGEISLVAAPMRRTTEFGRSARGVQSRKGRLAGGRASSGSLGRAERARRSRSPCSSGRFIRGAVCGGDGDRGLGVRPGLRSRPSDLGSRARNSETFFRLSRIAAGKRTALAKRSSRGCGAWL